MSLHREEGSPALSLLNIVGDAGHNLRLRLAHEGSPVLNMDDLQIAVRTTDPRGDPSGPEPAAKRASSQTRLTARRALTPTYLMHDGRRTAADR